MKIHIGLFLFYAKIFNKRIPLFVTWYLTNRCNLHCKYCDVPDVRNNEFSTIQIFNIVDELAIMGCKYIIFSGGEPLLREDIDKIIDYTKGKGIYCGINTNGVLVKKKINEIKNVDLLQLSFDGPKEAHDKQRGEGSYDAVIEALQIAKLRGIKTAFNITLTKYNVDYLKEIVEFIEKENVKAYIQPVAPLFWGNKNFRELQIPQKDYEKAIDYLLNAKKLCRFIANTSSGLKYLKEKNKTIMNCGAGKINCIIGSDGDVYPCSFLYGRVKGYSADEMGFKQAFNCMQPINCNTCLCIKTLDMGKMFSLDINAIKEIIVSSLK